MKMLGSKYEINYKESVVAKDIPSLPNVIKQRVKTAIKADFAESDLPYLVDVIDWHRISPEFQAVIQRSGLTL